MAEEKLTGNNWTAIKEGNLFVVSINDKCNIVESLNDFATKAGIHSGSVSGIGAVDQVKLKFYEPENGEYDERKFKEQLEMTNLSGNLAIVEGERLWHLHITLGRRDYSAIAGHLEEATVSGACELYIQVLSATLKKAIHPENGLNIYKF